MRDESDEEELHRPAIRQVEAAAKGLQAAVGEVVDAIAVANDSVSPDIALLDAVKGIVRTDGRETRLTPTAAFRQLEQAVTSYRAAAIRTLVDEEGMTFSAVAELVGVSRQMVARLYRKGPSG